MLSARPLLGFDSGVGILRGLPGLRPGKRYDYTLVLTFPGNVSVTGNVQAEVISGSAIVGTSGSNNGRVE